MSPAPLTVPTPSHRETILDQFTRQAGPFSTAPGIRQLFAASLEDDRLGIPFRREGAEIRYAHPVAVRVSETPAT